MELNEKLEELVNETWENPWGDNFSVGEFETVIEFLLEKKGIIGLFYDDFETDYFAFEIRNNKYLFIPYDLAIDRRSFGRCYLN